MDVQGIENLTRVAGEVLTRRPHPKLEDYDLVTIRIEEIEPVPGKAHLLKVQVGDDLDLTVRRELLSDSEEGARIRCRAKRTMDGAMCEPHPDPADFLIYRK